MTQECIFCNIRDGDLPSEILYRNDNCFVIRDIAPKAPVHLLVIPNRHFTFLNNLTTDHYPMIGAIVEAARDMAAQEGLVSSGYRLVINQGNDSGQAVDHLHLHVLGGRLLGDMG